LLYSSQIKAKFRARLLPRANVPQSFKAPRQKALGMSVFKRDAMRGSLH
jgi:hypothetical protein